MILDYNNLPKKEQKSVFVVIILLALFLLFASFNQFVNAWNNYRNAGATNIYQTVSFTGEGKVTAKPDTAKASVGLITEGKDTIAVQNENSSKMNTVIKFLKGRGIDDADIKTSNYSLSPKYKYSNGKSSLDGYILSQGLEVTIRDLNKIGTILDGVVSSGANQINSVSIFVDKPEELKNKAREEAVNQAKNKALEASRIAGLKLGRLVSFSENVGGQPPMFFETMGKGGGAVASAPNVEPGSQEITIGVTLIYLTK